MHRPNLPPVPDAAYILTSDNKPTGKVRVFDAEGAAMIRSAIDAREMVHLGSAWFSVDDIPAPEPVFVEVEEPAPKKRGRKPKVEAVDITNDAPAETGDATANEGAA